MANLLLAHIKRMFNWTVERGLTRGFAGRPGEAAQPQERA